MKLHLPLVLLAAVVSAVSYAEDVTHTLNTDTAWKNDSTIINNQSATIEAEVGTSPNFEISGYSSQAFYSLSGTSGATTWLFQNLGDISVKSNNIAITNSALPSNNPSIYQGIFSALNLAGYGVNTLQIKDSGDISFSNNSISFANSVGYGAPILSFCQYQGSSEEYTVVSIDGNNKKVLFDSNSVTGSRDGNVSITGGCILIAVPASGMAYNHPKVTISGSESLTLSNNVVSATSLSGTAKVYGGALYGGGYQIFDLSDNKAVNITGNSATATAKGNATASGGGAYGNELRLSNVQNVTISGNKVESYSENGAADSSGAGCMLETLVITNNGTVEVSDNVASADGATSSSVMGGGLAAAFATLTGNEEIKILNNGINAAKRTEATTTSAVGGGIESACLTIADNKNATFRGNYITNGNQTTLSALTLVTYPGLGSFLDVSALKDGSVYFYDPINVTDANGEPVVNFNKATDGVEGSGEGTIIFSGKHTEEDLGKHLGKTPTAEELEASRTSSVACETKLHGGTMRIEEQAVFSAEKFTVQEDSNATVQVKDATLKADSMEFGNSSTLETEGKASVEADSLTFAAGSSLIMNGTGSTINASAITFENGSSLTLNVDMSSESATTHAFAITSDDAVMDGTITLNLNFTQNLRAGSYKILLSNKEEWTPDNVTTTGLAENDGEVVWKDGMLYLNLSQDKVSVHDPLADAVQAANWGVYNSSHAFTNLLWAPRTNTVMLNHSTDGKSSHMTTDAAGITRAWGSAYSSFSRNSSSGNFAGAEYNIFGAAIGVEHQFKSGKSIGVAFGYDCGKASPFSTSRVDQESWHAALYGRAAEWKMGSKSTLSIDWSAATGSTTSEHNALGSDWSQENIQLDARVTYSYAHTERTNLYAFAGAQYYAQSDDSTARVQADSMQNLRMMMGGGASYMMTARTSVYAEALMFCDAMRHNPDVTVDGFHYGTGANPGRLGGSITVGAQYQLTPDWALRGSYSYEGSEDSNVHSINVGAVYSF